MIRPFRGIRLVLGAALLLTACATSSLTPEEDDAVRAWLLCDDCTGGERRQVAALGNRAVPTLAVALREGPSATGRANVEAQLRDLYQQLAPIPATEAEFVAEYLEHYVVTFRSRAATSLGDIATRDAIAALQDVLAAHNAAGTVPLPPAVLAAVHYGAVQAYPPFRGTLGDSVVAAFDTVTVRRGPVAWDGDETVSLRGAPFPDDLVVFRNLDSLRFLAVAPPGTYQVTIAGEPGGPTRTPLRITSSPYQVHTENTARALGGPFPTPLPVFLLLAPPPIGDTVDLFEVRTVAEPLRVMVTADWTGSDNLDLEWHPCPGMIGVELGSGATGNRPEVLGVQLPGPGCRLVRVALRGSPRSPAIVRLILTSP